MKKSSVYSKKSNKGEEALIRASAISKYSFSRSIPTKSNPSSFAAIPVEPEPINGSRTIPPFGVTRRQSYFINSIGLTVG